MSTVEETQPILSVNMEAPSVGEESAKETKSKKYLKLFILYLLTIIMVIAKSCDTVLYVRLTYEIQNYM